MQRGRLMLGERTFSAGQSREHGLGCLEDRA
jgi:hypothetical protein